jgi:23S rRNA (uracil1939-C5)-methyltransferase
VIAMIKKRKPLPTETPTVVIENLAHDGRGVTHLDGKTIFIDNALPGETVQFQYTARHGKFDEGLAIKIEQPSADRVEPRCPHAIICGGCSSQHIASEAQIRDKERVLFEQLAHFGNVKVEERLPPLTSEVWGYRRKARLGVKYVEKKGGALVGFREKRSSFSRCDQRMPRAASESRHADSGAQGADFATRLPQQPAADRSGGW